MKYFSVVTVVFLVLAGCTAEPFHRRHVHPHHTAKVTVYHFRDGRYGYRSDDGAWFYLYMMSTTNSVYYIVPYSGNSGGTLSIPASVTWSKGNPPTEKEVEESETETANVEEGVGGEPVDEATGETAGEAASDASSDASGSDSSSGSSDSGGDGGGDGD